jgi:ferredoxin
VSAGASARTGAPELRVDRVACSGHGICASLLPRTVALDEWGYPLVVVGAVRDDVADAEAAVRLCPARALYLTRRA